MILKPATVAPSSLTSVDVKTPGREPPLAALVHSELGPLRAVVDASPDLVLIVDRATGEIAEVNAAACRILGYQRQQLIAARVDQIRLDRGGQAAIEDPDARPSRPSNSTRMGRDMLRHRAGYMVPVQCSTGLLSVAGKEMVVVFARPERAPGHADAKLGHGVGEDALTGLPDRRRFDQTLARALEAIREEPRHLFAVLFVDIDRFKGVNDRYGHARGDRLLRVVAERMARCVRPGDVVARRGGDEFTVLLDALRSTADAIDIAERIRNQIARPIRLDTEQVTVTASVGIAFGKARYGSPESLIHDADRAMYDAKNAGRDRCRVCTCKNPPDAPL